MYKKINLLPVKAICAVLILSIMLSFMYVCANEATADDNIVSSYYTGNYYTRINAEKEGLSLRSELAELITVTHTHETTYSELSTVYKTADADPNKKGNIIWFYTGTSVPFNGFGSNSGDTNREHVWPKSGGNAFPEKSGPGSDGHHLRPCEAQLNATRGNMSFAEVESKASNVVKEAGSISYSNLCYTDGVYFYPGEGYRGATARILMYLQVRWGDTYSLSFVDSSGNRKTIGKISDLMKWHLDEPPTKAEIYRNEEVFKLQGNRNPFIDHPEYAVKIFCNDGQAYNARLKEIVKKFSGAVDSESDFIRAVDMLNNSSSQSEKLAAIKNAALIYNDMADDDKKKFSGLYLIVKSAAEKYNSVSNAINQTQSEAITISDAVLSYAFHTMASIIELERILTETK